MPINPIVLQRRHAEVGRIRLGVKVPTGNGRERPEKLDRFRFTSPDAGLIAAIAAAYGGEAKPWRNGTLDEHEVITDAQSIPVFVVKGGFSQWLEHWSGGGCLHRCDGVHNVLTDEACDLDETVTVGRKTMNLHREVLKPTTRLSVMLTDLETLGVWRLESHGWNAAAELPTMAELAQMVGDLVPARLYLHERKAIVDGKTSRFVVPGLDLQVTKARLAEIASGVAGGAAQIEAAPASGMRDAHEIAAAPAFTVEQAEAALGACSTSDEVSALWRRLGENGLLTEDWKARLVARAREIDPPAEQEQPAPVEQPALDEPVDAEVVDDDPVAADAAWQRLVAAAGKAGMKTPDLMAAWESHADKPTEQGTAADFDDLRVSLFGAES